MRARLLVTVLVLAALVGAAVVAGTARGVTPGKNGLIYFDNFSDDTETSDIYVISPDGTGLKALTSTDSADEVQPSASPDGKSIAFVSDLGGETNVLEVMASDGTGAHQLTGAGGADDESPTWSPNGRQIAFSRCTTLDDNGDCTLGQIAVINADGTKLKVLSPRVTSAVDDRPTWSPDGRTIAFQRTDANGSVSLWTVGAGATSVKRILNDGSDVDRNPSFTPDGRRLIFTSDVGGPEAIWQVNANGHGKKKLFNESPDPDDPTTGGGAENSAVAPNGRQFVYTGGGDLWIASINGATKTQLTHDGGDDADWARG